MQLKELSKTITFFGRGLLARIKYGFFFKYDPYDYLSVREEKQAQLEQLIYKTLYK